MIKWRYITGENEHAAKGIASDAFLTYKYTNWAEDNFPEPTLHIYTYRSFCALVGRYQNLEAEVNLPVCRELGIEVNRRITGTGAVIMGENNLMISLASSSEHPIVPSHPARILARMARGVISGLAELGIQAEYRAKNDIVVDGRKIGGSGIFIEDTGAFLYQASVLLDFDVPLMLRALNIPAEKLSDKKVDSFNERLTTVAQVLGHSVDVQQARESICRGFEKAFKITAAHIPFSQIELEQIEKLKTEKYTSHDWLYQRQPAPDMLGRSARKTPAGMIQAYAALTGDTLKSVLITGDFISGGRLINDIESALKWGRADKESITRTIRVVMANSGTSIQGLEASELGDIIYSAVVNARK